MKLRTKISEEAYSSRAVRMLSDKSSKKGLLATSGNQWDVSKNVSFCSFSFLSHIGLSLY